MNILDQIAAVKREEVRGRKITTPVTILEKSPFFSHPPLSFKAVLSKSEPSVIAEFKRKSPSKGDINKSADIRKVTAGYQKAGVSAVSVLTDEKFFGGCNSDLRDAADILKIPILRKDFIIDEYQVVEARSLGASAILLIAAILTAQEIDAFSRLAKSLGMDVLFEIHDLPDMEKMSENTDMIGVNNRNLKTFKVSMHNSTDLLQYLPQNCLKVAESGFRTFEDVMLMFNEGYDAFLIGERFMKEDDPAEAARKFISNLKSVKG